MKRIGKCKLSLFVVLIGAPLLVELGCGDPSNTRQTTMSEKKDLAKMPYRLKVKKFPIDFLIGADSKFDSWTKELVNLSSEEIKNHLRQRWGKYNAPGWDAFVARLLAYDPYGVTVEEGVPYIVFGSQNGPFWVLPPPVNEDLIRQTLSESDFAACEEYIEFLCCFSGLGESPAQLGEFLDITKWDGLLTLGILNEDTKNRHGDDWSRAALVFHSMSGDLLCLRSDGVVAWSVMDNPDNLNVIGKTFDESLMWLSEVMDNSDRHLDSYSKEN